MQLSSDVRIPDGILAANALLAENSHQGFGASTHTVYQGFGVAISSTALGIPGALYDGDVRSRCTGKERDAESGNDYFPARYYASSMGRWLSPDDPFNDQSTSDPQSWNLYGYARNNPLTNTDPYGLSVQICDNNGNCHTVENSEYIAAQQGNNGSLNVPTLDQVGMNGNGSGQFNATAITDANGNTVGTATYVSDGPTDYYANSTGINKIAQASATVGPIAGVEMLIIGAGLDGLFAESVADPTVATAIRGATKAVDYTNKLARWKQVPPGQKMLLDEWLGPVKGSGGAPGPMSPNLTKETIEAYRDVSTAAGNVGRDGVGSQAARLPIINQALSNMK
ncbi:MAG TPA: RHS repeat-associated core domain-containing protein [Terracidiphilus sp.]